MIRDSKKTYDKQSALEKIDLMTVSKTIENEIELLKSKQLLAGVIDNLGLQVSFHLISGFRHVPLYQELPVGLEFDNRFGLTGEERIKIILDNKISFSVIDSSGASKKFRYGDLVKTRAGVWKLRAAPALDKYLGREIGITLLEREKAISRFQKALEITQVNKLASAVLLSINDEVPRRGQDILNCLVRSYNSNTKRQQNREVQSTLTFLDVRIDSLSRELSNLEAGIAGFMSKKGLTDLNSNSRISLENMQGNDVQLNEINLQISRISDISDRIKSGQLPSMIGVPDPALASLIEKLTLLELKRESLLATTPETNPNFEAIVRQIRTTQLTIKENVEGITSSLIRTREKLLSLNSRLETTIKNIPTHEREYISRKRQQAIKENLYTYLLQKREELAVNYASTVSDDMLIDEAYVDGESSPNKLLIYALACLAGFFFPIVIIFARNNFSDKVRDIQEIKDALQAPVMVELPEDNQRASILLHEKLVSPASEQIRLLRSKLYHLFGASTSGNVTLLTSSLPGEGKTFVSSNLGVSLALMDKRTVILELDLRKPKLAKVFGKAHNQLGIGDYLIDHVNINTIIQPAGLLPNLDLICCGTSTYNPAELFEMPRFAELIDELRLRYDHIVIDSPPVHLVPDAFILSRFSDLILYVVRQGITDKRELLFINELYSGDHLNNMHIILNGVNTRSYGYGYAYNFDYYGGKPKASTGDSIKQFFTRF